MNLLFTLCLCISSITFCEVCVSNDLQIHKGTNLSILLERKQRLNNLLEKWMKLNEKILFIFNKIKDTDTAKQASKKLVKLSAEINKLESELQAACVDVETLKSLLYSMNNNGKMSYAKTYDTLSIKLRNIIDNNFFQSDDLKSALVEIANNTTKYRYIHIDKKIPERLYEEVLIACDIVILLENVTDQESSKLLTPLLILKTSKLINSLEKPFTINNEQRTMLQQQRISEKWKDICIAGNQHVQRILQHESYNNEELHDYLILMRDNGFRNLELETYDILGIKIEISSFLNSI